MLLYVTGMKNLLHITILSFFLAASQAVFTAEAIAAPSSLERAKELILSNKPADALAALSSYYPSHEEMSAYHYAFARALVALKQPFDSIEHYRLAYIYADSTADRERLLQERASGSKKFIPWRPSARS